MCTNFTGHVFFVCNINSNNRIRSCLNCVTHDIQTNPANPYHNNALTVADSRSTFDNT